MATTLAGIAGDLLPKTITDPIFDQIQESSAVMALARRVPLSMTANTSIPVSMDIPVPGWVAEGGRKPVSNTGVSVKQMQGKKLAVIVPVSEEVAKTNAAGLYAQLRQDLPIGFARAFDHAAIHDKDLRTGADGPFAAGLKTGANQVELGTASQANGGMFADLVNGEKLVVDAGYDFTGFAADPRLRPTLKLGTDNTGRPLWVDGPGQGFAGTSLIGYPATYNRGVSGSYRRSGNRVQVITITGTPTGGTFTVSGFGQTTAPIAYNAAASTVQTAIRALGGAFANAAVTGSAGGPYTVTLSANVGVATAPLSADGSALTGGTSPTAVVAQTPSSDTKLRALGGDWSQAAYGVGMDISVKVSEEATIVDEAGNTISAFQDNFVFLRVEAYFGFVKSDAVGAFTAYTDNA